MNNEEEIIKDENPSSTRNKNIDEDLLSEHSLNSFKITDIESAKEEIVTLRKKLNNKKKEISLLKNEQNPNELPVINKLKQQVNDLNSEVKKLRNDSNVKNYTKLENNYILNNKELTQLKQENNMIRFQLENLNRKKKNSTEKNNNNNFLINSNLLSNKIKNLKEQKINNLLKIYIQNNNSSFDNKDQKIEELKNELEFYKNFESENVKLKNKIKELKNSDQIQQKKNK